jgi:hypothetical protein
LAVRVAGGVLEVWGVDECFGRGRGVGLGGLGVMYG